MQARGVIRYEERAKQLNNFGGLRFGNITPTDLDGYIEYKDRLWVIMEFKYQDAVMPFGQRLAIERLCRDLSKTKPTLGILASHSQQPPEQIDCANAEVVEVWHDSKWTVTGERLVVKDVVDRFLLDNKLTGALTFDIEEAPALQIDWRFGVRCGITGLPCPFCRGVPCANSAPLSAA